MGGECVRVCERARAHVSKIEREGRNALIFFQ